MALIRQAYIKPRKNTRPQLKLLGVKGIVLHYTATPSATAENERKYFDNGAGGRSASAHIFVDKKEVVQIIPFSEVAYHANDKACKVPQLKATASYYKSGGANLTSIGVEMCIEKDGSLHPDTYKRTVEVVAFLCKTYKLGENDIFRHYDVTGKNCPAFWVADPKGFEKFKADVKAKLAPAKKLASKPKTSTATYKVVAGDTLSEIGEKFNISVKELKSLNGLKSDLIKVGQVLKVKATPQYYTVVKGDYLGKIAIKYNTSVTAIKSLNGLKSDLIKIGQKLRVK
jgi:N-acetylmuramoyl-L-alanine amidase